jgi:arylsulfatase A-like enzyme
MKILSLLPLVLLIACKVPEKKAVRKPNIILIMVDDMGFSDIAPYGGEIHTPNLTKLSKQGVRFTQFYNAGRCCPTRASLLTGLYPHQAGIGYMEPHNKYNKPISNIPEYQGYLNKECVTMAEALKQAGYHTFMSGKWHVGTEVGQQPLDRGFDRFYGLLTGASHHFRPGNDKIYLDRAPKNNLPDDFYTTDYFTNYGVRFINEVKDEKPFFLYLAYTAPHWPLHAWPEDIAKYRGKYRMGWDSLRQQRFERQKALGILDKNTPFTDRHQDSHSWEKEPDKEDMDLRMAVYAAMIERMDRGIGQVIETLKAKGKLDNTLIVFLSDNGGCAEPVGKGTKDEPTGHIDSYQGYRLPWANASNTPFRLFKHWAHEGGIATPLIAFWPKKIPAGSINTRQTGHVKDLLSTFMEAAGAEYPGEMGGKQIRPTEGQSLLAAMVNPNYANNKTIYWEHEGNRALRDGNWKLVSYYNEKFDSLGVVGTGKRTGQWELYDLSKDRTETNNLVKTNQEVTQKLIGKYEEWTKRLQIRDWEELLHRGGYDH